MDEKKDVMSQDQADAYWKRNIRLIGILLGIWALVSIVFSVLLAGPLNGINFPGGQIPLSFWFAQQGSIITFVILIFVYCFIMDRIDKQFNVDE